LRGELDARALLPPEHLDPLLLRDLGEPLGGERARRRGRRRRIRAGQRRDGEEGEDGDPPREGSARHARSVRAEAPPRPCPLAPPDFPAFFRGIMQSLRPARSNRMWHDRRSAESRGTTMKTAYATTLCNGEGYLPGVEALGSSLRATGTQVPMVLM